MEAPLPSQFSKDQAVAAARHAVRRNAASKNAAADVSQILPAYGDRVPSLRWISPNSPSPCSNPNQSQENAGDCPTPSLCNKDKAVAASRHAVRQNATSKNAVADVIQILPAYHDRVPSFSWIFPTNQEGNSDIGGEFTPDHAESVYNTHSRDVEGATPTSNEEMQISEMKSREAAESSNPKSLEELSKSLTSEIREIAPNLSPSPNQYPNLTGPILNSHQVQSEWIDQYELGVYVTLVDLCDGTREVRRVWFSRSRFGAQQAETWWSANREKLYKSYNTYDKSNNCDQTNRQQSSQCQPMQPKPAVQLPVRITPANPVGASPASASSQSSRLGPSSQNCSRPSSERVENNPMKAHPVIELPRLTLEELREKTDNLGTRAFIGQGSDGSVYAATLNNGKTAAVKLKNLKRVTAPEIHTEFLTQVSRISRLKHENIVEMLGYGAGDLYCIWVYEFAPMGSLYDVLHGKTGIRETQPGPFLDWLQRVRIAVDVAKGLEYLHEKVVPSMIHGEIRSSNILLFHELKAKIGDFSFPIHGSERPGYMDDVYPGMCLHGHCAPE